MIGLLPSYPAVKDSGARWLGTIPASWSVMRGKRLFVPRTELARPDDIQLSATQAYGVIPQADFERAVGRKVTRILQHLEKRRHVEVDDFVISMRSFQGGLERAWASGCIRSSYVVLRPAVPLVVAYYAYLFKSNGYIRALQSTASFIRDGQDLNFANFCEVDLPCPPLSEQSAIARFLDHADRRIRRYIRAKQRLIKLLQEQRQAIVHRAVTRGLDPNVRLKPCGVEWLGDVPEHWEVLPLRRRWSVTDCKHLTVPFVEDGVPLASVREVQSFDLRLEQAKRTTLDWYQMLVEGDRQPRRGDLIYCRNVSVGAAAVVETDEPVAMGQDVCLIRSKGQNQRFLNYFLHSPAMASQLALLMVGSTFDRINVADVKSLLIVVPPRREQDRIAAFLDESLLETERAIDRCRSEQGLLREYRARLVADVVTGKLDVRDAAARLPESVEEPDEGDEVDTEADVEESSDEVDVVAAEAEA